MKYLLIIILLVLIGCKITTYPLEMHNGMNKQEYQLSPMDFIADSANPSEVMTPVASGTVVSFKQGKVICYEFTRSDGYKGCCCDGQFNKKVLDRIHRCGH